MLHSKSISNMIFFLFHINFLTCGVHIWMFRIVPGTWQIHSKHLLNEWIGLPLLGGSLLVYVLNMASWLNQKCKSPTVFFFSSEKVRQSFPLLLVWFRESARASYWLWVEKMSGEFWWTALGEGQVTFIGASGFLSLGDPPKFQNF